MHYQRFVAIGVFCLLSATALGRSIYVNGIDISSARSQTLNQVNLRIDENGNVYIDAPHYQVNEENTFTPLSGLVEGFNKPEHKPPQPLVRSGRPDRDPQAAAAAAQEPIPKKLAVIDGPAPSAPTEKPEPNKDTPKETGVEKEPAKLQNKPGVKLSN